MNVDEFFQKYNGKGIDFDGFYGFQCMDLYQQYNKEVVGGPHIPANASDVWNTHPHDLYDMVQNNPDNFPEKGDVVIWNNSVGAGFGHIAVCSTADTNSFVSFDQNWPVGSVCHFQNHVYTNVIGWLHPKTPPTPEPQNPIFTDQTKIPGNLLGEAEDAEIQQIRGWLADGKRDNIDLQNARKEIEQLKKDLIECQSKPTEVVLTPDLTKVGISALLIAAIKKIFG